jgi:hypothetical protein
MKMDGLYPVGLKILAEFNQKEVKKTFNIAIHLISYSLRLPLAGDRGR